MEKSLTQYYMDEKKQVLEKCKACGVCAKKCLIVKHTQLASISPQDIQKKIKAYLRTGETSKDIFARALSCMECFKCVDNCCPEGLNPLLVNEIIKWEYRINKIVKTPYSDPQAVDSTHRIICSIQLSSEEYQKLTMPTERDTARYVFFAGCNVYYQPEKILSALELTALITNDFAFVPGLDFCCGNVHIFYGSIDKAERTSKRLIEKLASYSPETVIFWCLTCLCRFNTTLWRAAKPPFTMVSFPQFLANHMNKFTFKKPIYRTVTLHEACKAAFTGVDLRGARDVLQKIPGVTLVEMPRHGENTVCCGSGAEDYFPKSFETVRDDRMQEASRTNADILADVCHHCHNVFLSKEHDYSYSVKNYIALVAEALGIEREDKFKKYRQSRDINKILEDAEKFIELSPFSKEKIIAVLNATILRE